MEMLISSEKSSKILVNAQVSAHALAVTFVQFCMVEAELEEAWLHEAGLSTLVSGALSDSPAEALLSTLTRSQAAMVKKRLDNYTQTLRKRNKQPIRHVRDVFSTTDASVSRRNCILENYDWEPLRRS